MNVSETLKKSNSMLISEHSIEIGQYEESMYFIDTLPCITAYDQSKIDALLEKNQGVGIIVGCFDERLSIRMISGFSCRLLGYSNAEDVLNETDASLLNIAQVSKEVIRSKLFSASNEVCRCTFRGKNEKNIAVRVQHAIGMTPNGEKLWYISIRRLGDMLYDALTGDYNRRGFIDYVNKLKDSSADLKDYAIIATNIKGFNATNELYGSEIGDKLILEVYNHFRESFLQPVVCARRHSDKFLMLVEKKNLNLEKVNDALKIPYSFGNKQSVADCTCGIYYVDEDDVEVSSMIDYAKNAEESIADAFVTPYAIFDPSMRVAYLKKIMALSYFDQAIANNEFEVYYQPVIDCKSDKIISAESLIRWNTKDGVMSPAVFIPALEENGCIARLDEFVVRSAIKFLRGRVQMNLPVVPISINVSRMDFFDEQRTKSVYDLLQRDEVARKYLHFEITETSHRSIKELQAEFITKVNSHGGKVYVDDFGVANSSIDLLSQYDFSVLKLDKQFISEMNCNNKVKILIESTIHMSHELNMKVIAEGVETEEQLSLLKDMDCDYIQGYYYSKPLNISCFTEYLDSRI